MQRRTNSHGPLQCIRLGDIGPTQFTVCVEVQILSCFPFSLLLDAETCVLEKPPEEIPVANIKFSMKLPWISSRKTKQTQHSTDRAGTHAPGTDHLQMKNPGFFQSVAILSKTETQSPRLFPAPREERAIVLIVVRGARFTCRVNKQGISLAPVEMELHASSKSQDSPPLQ